MAFDSRRSYTDGNLAPAGTFDVTAGSGSDFDGVSYVAIGLGATPLSGALDVDYIRVKAGVHAPVKSSQIPALSPWGLSLAALFLLGIGAFAVRRRRALAPGSS